MEFNGIPWNPDRIPRNGWESPGAFQANSWVSSENLGLGWFRAIWVSTYMCRAYYQARKRHININFLVRLLLGHPGNVPGTNRVCPRDKVGLSRGQTQVFPLLYTVEAQFVPGTNRFVPGTFPGCPKGGRESLCVKRLCVFFVPYSKCLSRSASG